MTTCPVTSGLKFLFHAGAITPVSSGTAVTSYADLSGNGANASFGNATYRTGVFPNGLPSVRTVNGAMFGNLSSWGTAGTFLLLASIPTPNAYSGVMVVHDGSSGNDYQQGGSLYLSGGGSADATELKAAGNIFGGLGYVPSTASVIGVGMSATEVVICDGTGVIRRRAASSTLYPQAYYGFGTRYTAGNYFSNPNAQCDIGVVGCWNRLPSDAEIKSLCQWASRETGLIESTESVHAF